MGDWVGPTRLPAQGRKLRTTAASGHSSGYEIPVHDGTRFSESGFARPGNRRRDASVSRGSSIGEHQPPLLAHPGARAPVESPVHGRKAWGSPELQENRVGSVAQNRPSRRYPGTRHVARLRLAARPATGNQPSQLSNGGGSRRVAETPARVGRAPTATDPAAACGKAPARSRRALAKGSPPARTYMRFIKIRESEPPAESAPRRARRAVPSPGSNKPRPLH